MLASRFCLLLTWWSTVIILDFYRMIIIGPLPKASGYGPGPVKQIIIGTPTWRMRDIGLQDPTNSYSLWVRSQPGTSKPHPRPLPCAKLYQSWGRTGLQIKYWWHLPAQDTGRVPVANRGNNIGEKPSSLCDLRPSETVQSEYNKKGVTVKICRGR